MNRRQLFASTLVLLWLLVAGGYLYSLEAPRWRPFVRSDLAQFDGAALRGATSRWQTPGHIAIVHFYDARCACSAASLQHIEDLQRRYGARIDHYIFSNDLAKAKQSLASRLPAAPAALAAASLAIPSSPAVAVWDEHGALAYFGPYSSGPTCGTGKDFVTVTLDALMRGENPGFINTTAVGCFCPWRRNESLGA